MSNIKVTSQQTHFRVNKFMQGKGFVWSVFPGTKVLPNPFNGDWVKGELHFSQEQAVYIYNNLRKRWWQL